MLKMLLYINVNVAYVHKCFYTSYIIEYSYNVVHVYNIIIYHYSLPSILCALFLYDTIMVENLF